MLKYLKDYKLCLPICKTKEKGLKLDFREYLPQTTNFIKDAFNINCPDDKNEIIYPNVFLIPFLGFDSKLNRIGYGGGFYDVTLKYYRF